MNKLNKKILFVLGIFFLLLSFSFHKAEATTCTSGSACTGGSGSWVAPAGVTSVTAEVWGGGGAGAGETANNDGGQSGGGGGAYSKKLNITVVPGNSYTVTIGAAGTTSTGAGTAGGDSWFCNSTSNCATINGTAVQSGAKGGGGGSLNTTNGTGGAAASGFGDTKFSGGDGGDGGALGTGSGAGGGSAGSTGNGGAGGNGSAGPTGGTAGAAGSGGGATGAAGLGVEGDGNTGAAPGGGGSGAYIADNTNHSGGAGAAGQVILTYTTVSNVSSTLADGSYTVGQVVPITVTFSEAVTVTGTPQITLETGITDEIVNYSSGSGSTILTFNYTVQAGDTSADLDYVSTSSLALNGGTITNAAGGNAVLTLPTVGGANSIAGQKAIVIDTTVPAAPGTPDMTAATDLGLSSTDNITSDTTPDFTISCESGATVTLYDDTTSVGSGTCVSSTVTVTSSILSGGTHSSMNAKQADQAGNISAASGNLLITIDTTAPTLTSRSISSNNPNSNQAKVGNIVTLSFTSSETIGTPTVAFKSGGVAVAGAVTTSNPSGNDWTASYTTASGDTEGFVTFTIDFSDSAGNAGTQVTTTTDASSVTFDKTAPFISEVTPVTTPTNDTTPNYTFSSFESGTITYGGDCSSATTSATGGSQTITFNALSEGIHSNCTIIVTDAAGNPSNTLAVSSFTIDTTAPTLAEVTPVTTPTSDSTPDYTFSSTEVGTITYGGDCSSATTSATSGDNTITFDSLSDGAHSNCTIIVTDAAGNPSNTLAVSAFTVDTAGPTLAEVTPVTSPTSDNTPDYTFSSTEAGTITYGGDCSSAATSATSGSNTITFNTLPDGTHSNCTIIVTDSVGNPSNTLAVTAFVVDTSGPVVSEITPVTSPTSDSTPDYTFNSTDNGTISYDGDCLSATTSAVSGDNTITFDTLTDGTHANCTIVVTDSSGNPSNTLAVSSFTIDTTAPTLAEVTPVTTPTSDSTPDYTFSSTEVGTITYGGDCSSATTSATSGDNTITFDSLSDGAHSNCTIIVTDAAGNPSNTLAVSAFTVDTAGPTLAEVTPVTSPTSDNTPDYTFSSTEAGTITYGGDCSSAATSATSGSNTITFNTLPDGTHSNCTIIVTDSVGNPSNTLAVTAFTVTTVLPATKFVILDPTDSTINTPATVTIEARKDDDSIDTNYQSDVTLVLSGSATGGGLIDIIDGVGTASVDDATAETVTLSLSDTESTGLDATSIQDIVFSAAPATAVKFVILDPTDDTAGNPIIVTVEAQKSDDSTDTSYQSDVTLVLSGSATGGGLIDIIDGVGTLTINDSTAEIVALSLSDTEVTGLDVSSTQDVEFQSVSTPAVKFVIINPADGTTGVSSAITVKALRVDNSIDTSYQSDVTLVLSGSAITGGLVDIVNGVGTKIITDAIAETVILSLLDTEGTGLDISSTQDIRFSRPVKRAGAPIVPPTLLKFTGFAYPEAALTIVTVDKDKQQETPVKKDVVKSSDGVFSITLSELPIGVNKTYGLVITDRDGRRTQTKLYNVSIKPETTIEKTIYAAPTLGVADGIVRKGDNENLAGYASPRSSVEVEIDGKMSGQKSFADQAGTYNIEINTAQISAGEHTVRTRQIVNGVMSDFSLSETFSVTELFTPKADLNEDGIINISDWSKFLSIWASDDDEAKKAIDFNGDRKVNLTDFSIFVQAINR